MIYIFLNLLPIGLASLVGLLIGAAWLRIGNRSLPGWRTLTFIGLAEFWCASILAGALILAPPEAGEWTMAIGSAVVIWIGFVLPALAVTLAVGKVSVREIVSACAYWLITMVAQAIVMKAWGLVPPPGP